MKKRLLSLLLALALCLSLACLAGNYAWADEGEIIESEAEENVTDGQLPEDPEESPETLPEETGEVLETEAEDTEVSEEAMLSAESVEETVTEAAETETYSTESGADNDEMFAGFVNSMFYRTRGGNHDTGNRLEGLDNTVYWLLYNEIVNVSHGNSSSTVFGITFEQMGIVGPYTAEELGVTEIFYEGSLTQEASEALKARRSFDFGKVIDALLADCPYDLYWYDKTASTLLSSNISYSGTSTSVSMSGTLTFSFPVEQEYAADTYQVDTSIPETVQTAVSNAQSIVSSCSTYSDEAKLAEYKNRICALVSYNSSAASGGTAYGNPWQLIWVFDGISSTKVVCEGYAKAFQYLCDISSFSGNICCYQVEGEMSGGTGAGGHMWNIVKLDSGKNYLVDVTNCDAGTIGNPDKLFLKEPVSGSVSDGYTFSCGSSSISYTYDADMFDIYTTRELTLAMAGDADPVARNTTTDAYYTDVSDALKAAGSGETVELLEDCSDDFVMVPESRALDLNGKTLTTEYLSAFNNSNVTDSSEHAGLLVCSNVTLNANNSQIPVKIDGGYRFFTITSRQRLIDKGADTLYIETKPTLGSAATDQQIFGTGISEKGLTMNVRLTYTNSNNANLFTEFIYSDTNLQNVYDGGTGKILYVSFKNVNSLTNMAVTTVIRSKETGAEFVCSPELNFPA